MNTRVLEIVKNTEILHREDLKLLASEIEKYPYMQSLRAVYLLGIHQYENENFQKELTKTAAYTTDKRILYHLINEKKERIIRDEEILADEISEEQENIDNQNEESVVSSTEIAEVEQNEEIIINDDAENSISEVIETEQIESVSQSEEEKPILTGIDFYVRNQPQTEQPKKEIIPPKPPVERPKPVYTTSIMDFYTKPLNKEIEEKEEEGRLDNETQVDNNTIMEEEKVTTIDFYQKPIHQSIEENQVEETENYEWKPMQIDQPISSPKKENVEISEKKIVENKIDIKEPILEVEKEIIQPKEEVSSNVSAFINTWQNWLKIDRSQNAPISEQERKAAIIDKFIENNPKISPIKDDVEFVVKEKSDDISHLMTETLAQLYVEQKLYTKAINAYKILQEKHPEKSEEFEQSIEEIKKMRHNK